MPIALGEHLPEPVATALADRMETHLTDHGLATELPHFSHYQPDGYWRGPIWAPATVLIVDGLRRAGHDTLAAPHRHPIPSAVRNIGFRGELRRPDRRRPARPRLHLDRDRLPDPRPRAGPGGVAALVENGAGEADSAARDGFRQLHDAIGSFAVATGGGGELFLECV